MFNDFYYHRDNGIVSLVSNKRIDPVLDEIKAFERTLIYVTSRFKKVRSYNIILNGLNRMCKITMQ